MARSLIQKDLPRGKVADRLGVALLVALAAILVLSVAVGVSSL